MRIIVCMLLYPERLVLLLKHYADVDIKSRCICRKSCIVCILHIASLPLRICRGHVRCHIFRVKVLDAEETSAKVYLSLEVTPEMAAAIISVIETVHAENPLPLIYPTTEG